MRNRLVEVYQRKENKPYIYHFALLVWCTLLVFLIGLATTLAQSTDRTGFYLLLLFSLPTFYITTYWLQHSLIQVVSAYGMANAGEALHDPNVITIDEDH